MLKLIGLVLVFIFFSNAVESKDTRKTKGNPNWFWNYCSKRNKCQAGEGDCDVDLDCEGDLKCGDDNCNGFLHKKDLQKLYLFRKKDSFVLWNKERGSFKELNCVKNHVRFMEFAAAIFRLCIQRIKVRMKHSFL